MPKPQMIDPSAGPNLDDPVGLRLRDAVKLASEAGKITLKYFRQKDLRIDRKSDDSPVTAADREAEEYIRNWLADAYPDDAIVGEEHGEVSGNSEFCWVVDPIDGTKSFISGVPLYTCLIGIMKQGQSVAGVIHAPAAEETVYARLGGGAWHELNGSLAEARVSDVARLSEATLVTTGAADEFAQNRSAAGRAALNRLDEQARLVRTWGDGYGYLLVATSRADVMIDPIVNLWDVAALVPVIREAGGTISAWDGGDPVDALEAVASNGRLHDEVLAITRGN